MTAFAIQNTRIETVADATLDQPVIRIAPTPFGQRLALLFDGQPQADGDYVVRHTPDIDERMVDVCDELAVDYIVCALYMRILPPSSC